MFLKLYKTTLFTLSIFCQINAFAQTSVSNKIKKLNLYAGIEVGSKGVKLSIIQMAKNATNTGNFSAVKDSSINTDFISFSSISFAATVKALVGLYNTANTDYSIPSNKIYTVVSSGVKGQAEKENKSFLIKSMADSFRLLINEPQRLVPVIDAMEEAKLSHMGIVPEARRYNTFLIDIGSGNTKGGYFRNGNTKELKLFTLTWGTKTITNATDKRLDEDKSVSNFKKQLFRVITGEPEQEIIYAVNESGAYNMNDYFAFSGGIAWSAATLMYPELIENTVVPLTFNELVRFSDKLNNNFASLSPEALVASVTDITLDKNAIMNEAQRVHKVFDQKSLMAGTALLLKIVRQFEGTLEKKQFFLVKNGQVGWISAYVNQEVHN